MKKYPSAFHRAAPYVLALLLIVALPRSAPAPIIYQQPTLSTGLTSDHSLLTVDLTYEAVGGWSNTIQYSPDLFDWSVIDAVIPATDGTVSLRYLFPLNTTRAFFRLGLPQVQINFAQPYLISTAGGFFYIIGQVFDPSYTVWIDGIMVSSTFIDSSTIQVNVGPLSAGFHDIVIRDSMNNIVATLSHGLQVTTTGRTDQESPPEAPAVNDAADEMAYMPGEAQAMADFERDVAGFYEARARAMERGEDVSDWEAPTWKEPTSDDTGSSSGYFGRSLDGAFRDGLPLGMPADLSDSTDSRGYLGRSLDGAFADGLPMLPIDLGSNSNSPNPPSVGLSAADSAALSRLFLGEGVVSNAPIPIEIIPLSLGGVSIPIEMIPLSLESAKLQPLFAKPRVNEATGELFIEYLDLVIPGRGLDLVWGRTYRSKIGLDTAMGVGWDFSYNIRAAQSGPNITVQDGQNRTDTYFLQSDGSFSNDELFRRGTLAGNVFTLQFADKTSWLFKPLDGSPASGKIDKIIDRNSNQLQFQYDGSGRLNFIIDTLGRSFQIGYDGAGRIQAVQDFSGRFLQYQHLTSLVPGVGSAGDLVSVRSQAVTGTPIGNDFPSGKAAQFTYSTGLGAARDHNLLTARDGNSVQWFQAVYTTTSVVTNFLYDRVSSRTIGTAGESKVFTYLSKTPTPANRFNTTKTIVNDAVGNVHESLFDSKNRLIDLRQFTGRSTPGVAVTESANRPINPVRPTDPAFFTTTINWNRDSLPTRVTFPRGNGVEMVYQRDFDPATNPRERGNLRVHRQLPVSGAPLVQRFEHLIDFGTTERPKKKYEFIETYPAGRPLTGDFSSSSALELEELRLAPVRADISVDPAAATHHYIIKPARAGHTSEPFGKLSRFASIAAPGAIAIGMVDTITAATDARGLTWTCARDANGNATGVTRPDGVTTDIEHNANGQLTAIVRPQNNTGHRERDEWHYYSGGPQNGYLQSFIRDAGGLNLTTGFTHNSVGCVTQVVDPRGRDTQFFVNQLNQVVQIISRNAALSGPVIRYLTNIYRDANNRITSIDVQNKDEFGTVDANAFFTTSFGYDSLDHATSMTREVDSSHTVTTQYFYDVIRDLIEVRSPLAVAAVQPDARVQFAYDERRLPFTATAAPSSGIATGSTYTYDENGNLTRRDSGAPAGPQHTVTATYDGFDYLSGWTSPVGTQLQPTRNANHQVTSFTLQGNFLDAGGSPTFGPLRSSTFVYDNRSLLTQRIDNWFDRITGAPLGDGARTTSIGRDPALNVTSITDDNGHATSFSYDNANRPSRVTDAKGNHVDYGYDANSNRVTRTRTDKSDTAAPDQVFILTNVYDGLDRLITGTDNVGNARSYMYDSRSNRVRYIDPRNNLAQYQYDGLNRTIRSGRDMNANSSGFDAGIDIISGRTWDDNSRAIGTSDPNSHATQYTYDALGRLTRRDNADATFKTWTRDAWGNAIQSNDENGTFCINNYDDLNRLKQRQINPGPGVSNATTFEIYDYPGDYLSPERAINNASTVSIEEDSIGDVERNTLNNRTTVYTYDGVGNLLTLVSPGGRRLTYSYDTANLCTSVSLTATSDGDSLGTIATYSHIGHRIESVSHRNTTSTLYTYDGFVGAPPSSDLGWGKVASALTLQLGSIVVDQRTFSYDANGNLSEREDTRSGGPQLRHHYDYDAANRNNHTQVNAPGPTLVRDTIYNYDLNGNRIAVNGFNTPDPGSYFQDNTTPAPADAQMNQYTTTPLGGYSYDANGNRTNVTTGAGTNYTYDYKNRLIDLTDATTNLRIANYQCDALGRRIQKTLDPDGTPSVTNFIYTGRTVLEERNGGGAVTVAYSTTSCVGGSCAEYRYSMLPVQGETKDEHYSFGSLGDKIANDWSFEAIISPVEMRRGGINSTYHAEVVPWLWFMTNASGGAAERYEYEDFGDPHIMDGSGAPLPSSAIGNPYLFKGMRFDVESGLYLSPHNILYDIDTVRDVLSDIFYMFDPKIGASLQRESSHAVNGWGIQPLMYFLNDGATVPVEHTLSGP